MKNKKILYVVIGLVVVVGIVLFVLISPKKVTCTSKSDQSQNGYVIETKEVIYPRGKNVSKVVINQTITSKDSKKLDSFEKQFKEDYASFDKKYGGYKYKVTKTKDKVVSDITIDYTKLDMKKFITDNEAMKKYTKNNKLTVAGAKEMYEASGAVCK